MKRATLLIGIVLLLGACSKSQDGTLASGDFAMTLTAQLPEMPLLDNPELESTKATTQYTVRIKWTAGDKISAINMTTGKVLGGYLTANQTGTLTTFSGSLSGTVSEGDVITYFFPALENTVEEDYPGIHIDMSNQTGKTGTVPLCVYCSTKASGDGFNNVSLTFSYLMCYIMMGLSDIPASAQVKNVTLTNVTNAFDLSINAAHTGFDIASHTGDIVLSPSQSATSAGVRTVYAAVPGSAAVDVRYAVLETNTTSFSTTFTAAKLNNGTAYNTNISGFLVDDMVPADPNVRTYCLDHFDANGDGKLSMVEIAGVTAFPNQSTYPLPSDITRFNELEYFYGLTSLPTFKNQKRMESITIPKQITALPNDMFYGCTTLTKVILKPTVPPTLGSNVFYGLSGSIILVVADEVVSDYQTAPGWSDYFNNFRTESSQNDSSLELDLEDEDSMGEERIDIIIS